ncbi:MAG TPA: Ig-like domain-containing protein, partial [Gemmatimonadaceae bacterium]|nr:Ig-like domain-containing protein [Gemmatimonadaceae bacterium]
MRRFASLPLLVLVACGGGDTGSPVQPGNGSNPPPPAPVATVAVAPDTATLVRAQGRTLAATLRDAAGNVLAGRAVAWSSSAVTVATVTADGAVTAVAPGVARIAATSEGKEGAATITVAEGGMVGTDGADLATTDSTVRVSIPAGAVASPQPVTIARLTSPPTHPRLVAGTTVTIAPTAALARAATLRLAYRGATLANGADSSRFRLHRHDGNAWVEIAGGSVNIATREVSGGTSALGTFGVIELPPLPIVSITLSRDTATLVPLQTAQLVASARDSSGGVLANRSLTWTTGNAAVASVSAQGLVTAIAPGTAVITATAEGKVASATITVKEGGFVTTSGGTIATVDGRASVTVPAGALAQAQAITIEPIANPVANPRLVPGTAFDFGPSQAFAQPVTMTLRYQASAIPGGVAASTLRLFRLTSGQWVEVPGSSVDVAASTVTGPTSSFSSYAVLAGIPAQAVTITWNGGNTPVCSLPAPASCGLQFGGWKVPDGVYQVTAELWGAAGGGANGRGTGRGLGGKTSAVFAVYPGEEFQVVVGIGGNQVSATGGGGAGAQGLFLYPDVNRNYILTQSGRSGGGATWMRRGTFAVPLGGPGRVVVAGGGGGDGGPALV